tara:strand:+ start:892 stop:1203 length:312 start_codon:yes stop_codon:yes gene_type:complete
MNTWKLQPMLNESKKHALARDFMNKFEGTDYKVPLSLDEFIDAHRDDMTAPELRVGQSILSLFDDETRWDDSGKLNCDICKTCYHSNDETELRAHFNINIEDN